MTDDSSGKERAGAGPRGIGPAGAGVPRVPGDAEETPSGEGVHRDPGAAEGAPSGSRPRDPGARGEAPSRKRSWQAPGALEEEGRGAAVPVGIGLGPVGGESRSARRDERIERLRTWLEAYASALESGDLAAIERLFAVQTSYQPGPFAALLRGRRAIRGYWEGVLPARSGLAIAAEVLGAGATHGIAHWRLVWRDDRGREAIADGVLIVASDPLGRCTSLREWTIGAPS